MYQLDDRRRIEAYLRRDVALHLYALGDLDPAFWPLTSWFAQGDGPDALALLYQHPALPTLMMLCRHEQASALATLAQALAEVLPDTLYLHWSDVLGETLLPGFELEPRGVHRRMMLTQPSALEHVDSGDVAALGQRDAQRVVAFYDEHYPGHWFDRRLLDTGCYFALEVNGELASVAGVHVVSQQQRVAALGNIATAQPYRGRGLATRVTAAATRHLRTIVDAVGLNVAADNVAAIACYRKLGFEVVADYREAAARRRVLEGESTTRPLGGSKA